MLLLRPFFFHQFWRRKLKSEKQIPYMSVGYQKCIYERVAWMGKRTRNTHFSNGNENELKETCQNVLCFQFTIYYAETVITTHFIFGHQRIFINISFERFLPFYIYAMHTNCVHIEHLSKEEKNTATKTMTWYLQVFSFYSLGFFYWLYSVCFHNSNNQPANINTMTNISHSTFEITKLTLLNLLILFSITNQRKITFFFESFCFVCLFKILDVQAWENCSNFLFNHIA